MLMKSVTLILA
jgi:hypothetical protein